MKKICVLLMILTILIIQLPINASSEIIVSENDYDKMIIPDKYNTGCNGELEEVVFDTENPIVVNDVVFITSGGTKFVLDFHYRNKDKSGDIIIENKDFSSNAVTCYHEDLVDRNIKVIFNNCRFKSMSTGKGEGNVSYEFNNCTMNSFYGSNSILNRCQFGENYTDGIVPFCNIEVNDCFFKDMAGVMTDDPAHTDGTQLYGHAGLDVENIKYNNCRFEIPPLHLDGCAAGINACIMLQLEFSSGKDILFKNCIVNGGGYSIYARSTKDELTQTNVKFDGIKFGCAARYGLFYSRIHPDVEFSNISRTDSLYVGTVWKDDEGTHFSVTNDTNDERDLLIYTDKGTFTYKIPGCPLFSQMTSDMLYKDLPFDMDIVIPEDCSYAVCYDNTESKMSNQIRFVNYTSDEVVLDSNIAEELYSSGDEILNSGKCGNDITYTLTKSGILTLSGTGSTYNYHSQKFPEWDEYKYNIKEVIVEEGIVELGTMIFRNYSSIEKIHLPDSLTTIGQYAFAGCVSLDELTLPKNIKTLGKSVFSSVIVFDIKYEGDDWSAIDIASGNESLISKVILLNEKEDEPSSDTGNVEPDNPNDTPSSELPKEPDNSTSDSSNRENDDSNFSDENIEDDEISNDHINNQNKIMYWIVPSSIGIMLVVIIFVFIKKRK